MLQSAQLDKKMRRISMLLFLILTAGCDGKDNSVQTAEISEVVGHLQGVGAELVVAPGRALTLRWEAAGSAEAAGVAG